MKYVVAVSGGADSMTLLDQCVKKKQSICVAHVNYQKRDTAMRDQMIVEKYCQEHQIECFVLSCDEELKGNFQAAARDFRYAFFKQLCLEQNCEGVMVAHQQDDVLETYLLQKESSRIPLVYGLASSCIIEGLKIERPLLSMTKQDCYDYCHRYHIEYGDDESNFTDVYHRNRIRHHVVEHLTSQQRQQLLDEIQLLNEQKQEQNEMMQQLTEDLDIQKLLACQQPTKLLRYWLNSYHLGYTASEKMLSQVILNLKINNMFI